jgi:hypothetical protein
MSPLTPDRERRHLLQFHLLPALHYGMRFVLAVLLILGGLAVQFVLLDAAWIAGLVLGGLMILAGNALLLLKGYDLTPRVLGGPDGDWERTTLERFEEARHLDRQVRHWDQTMVDITCGTGVVSLLLLVVLPVGLGFLVLASVDGGRELAILFAVDAALLFLPHWFTGLRLKWRPVSLTQRIDSLLVALDTVAALGGPPCEIQPRFHMVGKGKDRVPMDARVFIRFPEGPEDFLGLQFQVAINNVQGTRYPYLYAVLVAKEEFNLVRDHRAWITSENEHLTVSKSSEEDVEVIVIRQTTTKKTGFHTNPKAVRKIATAAWTAAARVVGVRATP